MRKALVGLLAGLALAACSTAQPATVQVKHVTISEDSPNWDCATMGNGLCGPGPVRMQ